MMHNGQTPQRPAEQAEAHLVRALLRGDYPPGTALPGERDLAAQLGITRPTLREVLGRLARDGWLTVQHGKSTLVNDIWRDGGLNALSAIVQHSESLPPDFIAHLLQVRLNLAPAYAHDAIQHDPRTVMDTLNDGLALPDTPEAYAAFDWRLHRTLTIASGNPVYTLILNGFAGFYEAMARLYFAPEAARQHSRDYYRQLRSAARDGDAAAAESLTRAVMNHSLSLWQQTIALEEQQS